jgi:hypothetical protein
MAHKKVVKQIAIDGKVYSRGEHDFSEAVQKHPHFKHFEKAGYIAPLDGEKKAPEQTPEQKALHDEMVAKYMPPKPIAPVKAEEPEPQAPAEESAPAPEADAQPEIEAEEPEPQAPAKKHHPKKGK